jgi:hypothetical protein
MIKLQLLLRHPSADIALAPAVRALLEQHGFVISASGRASVSAAMEEAAFAYQFGVCPAGAELAVPTALQGAISLITLCVRPSVMLHPPKVNHAAI